MAETTIVSKIIEAARGKGGKALAEAEKKRGELLALGMSELKAEYDAKREAARKHRQEAADQELSAFRLVEKNKIHVLKRKLLDGVYETVWNKVLEPATYRRWIEKRMAEHCRDGDALVVAAGQHEPFVRDFKDLIARHKVTLSEEKGRFRAGFIVSRGAARLNCTLDEEMKDAVRESEVEVSRILFGKQAEGTRGVPPQQ